MVSTPARSAARPAAGPTAPVPEDAGARAAREGTPLIDDGAFTWVWSSGDPPPALVGDWCDWDAERGPAWRRDGSAWSARLEVEPDAYLEYAFVVGDERVVDPLARERVRVGPHGPQHRAWMPLAPREAQRLTRRGRATVPAGVLSEHRLDHYDWAIGRRRRLWIHRPAGYEARDLPLLVVLDGNDYLRARMDRLNDALIADGRMAPVVTAFVANAGRDRMVEYACSEMTLGFLVGFVLAAVRRELGIEVEGERDPVPRHATQGESGAGVPRGPVTILGASAGGLMALHAGLRLPGVFGQVIAQSGAWELDGHELVPFDLVRNGPVRPIRIWMDAGRYEWLFEGNERMAALLTERGYDVTYRRFSGGHNWTSWLEELVVALPAMFPPADGPS